jgi:hypothetical protein
LVSTLRSAKFPKFCNQYGLGTELLDMCFRKNGSNLSKACVDALIAAGDVSRTMSTSRRGVPRRDEGQGGRTGARPARDARNDPSVCQPVE